MPGISCRACFLQTQETGLPVLDIRRSLLSLTSLLALCAVTNRPAHAAPDTALEQELAAATGHYAADSNLLGTGPLADILKQELGAQYGSFIQNMQVAGPLTAAGDVLFMTGNKPHAGGSSIAWLVLDRSGRDMTAGILNPGQLSLYTTGTTPVTKPADVRTLLENQNMAPPLCNQPQDLAQGARLEWRATLEHGATCVYRLGLHRGEQVTARLKSRHDDLSLRVMDPHIEPAANKLSWTVPQDDLYLVQVTLRPGATVQKAQPYRLTITAR